MITVTISAKVFWFLISLVLFTSGWSIYNSYLGRRLDKANMELLAINEELKDALIDFMVKVNRKLDKAGK
jgi:4-hydroxybenzoate polyprenyltransferase